MSGKGQSSNLQQAVQIFRKNQAKTQALSLKLAEEKAKVNLEAPCMVETSEVFPRYTLSTICSACVEGEGGQEQDCK